MYNERNFVIFNVDELSLIDFNQVLETSTDTVRKSVDGTLTFVKWDGENPPTCVENLTTKSQYYTYTEMLEILNNEVWSAPMENIE